MISSLPNWNQSDVEFDRYSLYIPLGFVDFCIYRMLVNVDICTFFMLFSFFPFLMFIFFWLVSWCTMKHGKVMFVDVLLLLFQNDGPLCFLHFKYVVIGNINRLKAKDIIIPISRIIFYANKQTISEKFCNSTSVLAETTNSHA